MSKIIDELYKLKDSKYKEFTSKLIPNIDESTIIGVRIPQIRLLSKNYYNDKEFINNLPHQYYEENLLHGAIITHIKNYDECIYELNRFLPYIDNWSVCDTINPKIVKKNLDLLIEDIKKWIKSKHTYTCRFGIKMLMNYYLDNNFKKEYLSLVGSIKSEEYYINMMIAWFYATSLSKQWDETIYYLENNNIDSFILNKTIQKACESYRITDDQKNYLRNLKRGIV